MAYLNKIMIIGNLGGDADVRTVQNTEKKAVSFNVATTKKYRDRSGEMREDTQWHRVEYWLDAQSKLADYLKKGTTVYVEGEMTHRQYKDANGVDKSISSIRATTIQLIGGQRSDQQGGQGYGSRYAPQPSQGFQPSQGQGYRQQGFQQQQAPQGFQQTGQFPGQPVNSPQYQQAPQPAPAPAPMPENPEFGEDLPF